MQYFTLKNKNLRIFFLNDKKKKKKLKMDK